jgi:pyruvate,orthophosphate dikinase
MKIPIARISGPTTEPYSPELVGNKAANLARMAALGLPVPPAFVLPIALCAATANGDPDAAENLTAGLIEGIAYLEAETGKRFGDRRRPLLVSVRSGAARSMPGMLDTVLDVGCTPAAVRGLIRMTGRPRFAHDCRRRFLESYGTVVAGLDPADFAKPTAQLAAAEKVAALRDLDSEALERLGKAFEAVVENDDHALTDNPMEQLKAAARAVFQSWTSERASTYRRLEHLDDLKGTAVTVQAMVFGNSGSSSGAGVAFSRDPSTGAAAPMIDVLFDSQGEDVVSGGQNPDTEEALAHALPNVAVQLRDALQLLERTFSDTQDVEFTIENGRLWILQTRAAKRTPRAALRFAIDFVEEGLIDRAEALRRLQSIDLGGIVSQRLSIAGTPLGSGTPASAGIAAGRAAFDPDSAARLAAAGDPVILVRPDTATADVGGFAVAAGIVTAVGGRTAHAALVARQMGKPCVVGCGKLDVDVGAYRARFADAIIDEGDWLSVDGEAGLVYAGRGTVTVERPETELAKVEHWRAAAEDGTSAATVAAAPLARSDGSHPSSG